MVILALMVLDQVEGIMITGVVQVPRMLAQEDEGLNIVLSEELNLILPMVM